MDSSASPFSLECRRSSRSAQSAVGPQDVWRWAHTYRLRGRRKDKMSDVYKTGVLNVGDFFKRD